MDLELTTENKTSDPEGEWSTAGSKNNKSKKQKKKFKNTRTVTLQTFFSENGGPVENIQDIKDDQGSSPTLELSEEEQVTQNSLISLFTDLMKRLGPVKRDE